MLGKYHGQSDVCNTYWPVCFDIALASKLHHKPSTRFQGTGHANHRPFCRVVLITNPMQGSITKDDIDGLL